MNCKQVEELLPLYAGRDLEEKRATLVAEHLQTCATCARVVDEYHESVQLTEQFAPPVFNEAVYAGIRQHVLREIEMEAMPPAWSQTIVSLFRARLTWAIASVLLVVVSLFAIYMIVYRETNERQLAGKPPAKVQPGMNSGSQGDNRAELQSSVNTGGKEQQRADGSHPRRNRSRERMNIVGAKFPDVMSKANNVSSEPGNLPEPMLFPPRESAALVKTLRVEIQTKDPKIKIIWFVQQETKSVIPSSKGT